MATYSFQTITAVQAGAYNGANDSVNFGAGEAVQVTAAYLTAPDQVAVSYRGQTVSFGTGVYGDLDLKFDNGAMVFVGGTGADNAIGTAADDAMFGGAGADTLNGAGGGDILQGNQGADSLVGGAGGDTVYGGQDNDAILLGVGADEANFANGNKGDDTIIASNGIDTVLGGQGNDSIIGGSGGDFLNGNLGDDTIQGGSGADSIAGEGGRDVISGGAGADVFSFATGASAMDALTADRILDWTAADRISLPVKGGYSEYGPVARDFLTAELAGHNTMMPDPTQHILAVQLNGDVVVFADTDADTMPDVAIILVGVSLSDLDASNFI